MARIAIVGGAGYVGVSYSILLADLGHQVTGLDTDPHKIATLSQGQTPIHEPGLQPLLERNIASGRLTFTTAFDTAIPGAEVVLICVGTPSTPSGAADMSAVAKAAAAIAEHATGYTIVVNKSTMPVGSNGFVADILAEHASPGATFDVVSSPEFLREGAAVHDIYHPSRIVLGATNPDAARAVAALFDELDVPIISTDPRSAEMVKYASNAFLANKISFINEIAVICEHLDADINAVVEGMRLDPRIGTHFLRPGVGFGGSCFPKDVRALAHMAREHGFTPKLLDGVLEINEAMRVRVRHKLEDHLGDLRGATIAILGLAFKPDTDDIREAPAIALIGELRAAGAAVRATDPVAIDHARAIHADVAYTPDAYGAAMGADAVVLVTEWDAYKKLDLDRLAHAMRGRLLIDGRNALDPAAVVTADLVYEGVGRRRMPDTMRVSHIASMPVQAPAPVTPEPEPAPPGAGS